MKYTIRFSYWDKGRWCRIPEEALREGSMRYETDSNRYECVLTSHVHGYDYVMSMEAAVPTQLRLELSVPGQEEYFHLIPCNIHGDNNKAGCVAGELPFLTAQEEEDPFCASRWEFRADRAASPLSALCFAGGAVGVSVDPYADDIAGGVRVEEGEDFVAQLNCYGTPMDTRQSVDEEGNLAFIRGCRLIHEYTKEAEFLEYLKEGAEYEYLWRFGYKARPECPPLNDGAWNSCGGSVTSVSNPHIHPMGVIVDADLRYLAEQTHDAYHRERAEDSYAWVMQCLERYPEKNGCGWYGLLSERWCPSDGLLVEQYTDGSPSSTWFSYNLWAAANALEAVEEKMLE